MLGGAALNRGATAARYLRERIKSSRHGRRSLRSATSRAAATAPPRHRGQRDRQHRLGDHARAEVPGGERVQGAGVDLAREDRGQGDTQRRQGGRP